MILGVSETLKLCDWCLSGGARTALGIGLELAVKSKIHKIKSLKNVIKLKIKDLLQRTHFDLLINVVRGHITFLASPNQ